MAKDGQSPVAHSALFDLSGRVAIVTGGNRGIGMAIATGLAQAGATIAIVARDAERTEAALQQLEGLGAKAVGIQLDLGDRSRLSEAVAQIEGDVGAVDILVNNAGVGHLSGGVLQETQADWDRVIDINLNATFLLSKYCALRMIDRRRGKIINLASLYSIFGSALLPSYSASKGAIVQLTKSMAIELAPHGIQVNAIAPGWIMTELTQDAATDPTMESFYKATIDRTPAGRWGEASEIAGTAVFLASSAADFITGVTLPVDGGYSVA